MPRLLLIVHGLLFAALIGATTHNAVFCVRALAGRAVSTRSHRIWTAVMLGVYSVTMALGLLIYPSFRTNVRADYLDRAVPLATGFFETKEQVIGLGLFALLWYFAASRRFDPSRRRPWHLPYHLAGLTVAACVWLAAVVGLTLVAIKPL